MAESTSPGAGIVGMFLGTLVAGGVHLGVLLLAGVDINTASIVAGIAAIIGGAYSALAFSRRIYRIGFLSILGFLLDLSWSMLNTLAGFLVWIPAARISRADFIAPDANSRRSGALVYNKNPRGGGYSATTIGTVITGGWSSHEEVHVWQSRIFGPVYMLAYVISLFLNMFFRLFTGKFKDLSVEAYYRIPFEEWAYWAGKTSGAEIDWVWWFRGLLLTTIYVAALVSIPIGIPLGITPLWAISIMALVIYSLVRAFVPRGH